MAKLEVPKVEQAKANVSMYPCPAHFTLQYNMLPGEELGALVSNLDFLRLNFPKRINSAENLEKSCEDDPPWCRC